MNVNMTMLHLGIGDLIISNKENQYVSTVLGSCVSVCLYSGTARTGGIIHYLHPHKHRKADEIKDELFFGECAIPILVEKMLKMPGVKIDNLTAKVIGGSNLLGHSLKIGQQNIEVARFLLHHYNIPIIGEHVNGNLSRKVHFFPTTGEVKVSSFKIEE